MKKSRLAVLLILILLFSSLSPAALAASILYESDFSYNDSTEKYDLHYTVDGDGAITITGKGEIESYAFSSGELPRVGAVSTNFFTSVSVGDQVTVIGEAAFGWNYALKTVSLGKAVETIEDFAFYDCTALTSISLPASLTLIGESAFDWCDNLTDVYFAGTKQQWNMVSINSYNSPLFSGATIHCSDGDLAYDLDYSIDDDGVLTFSGTGYLTKNFASNQQITRVVINDGLLGLPDSCFNYCYNLKAFEVSSGNPKYSSKDGVLFDKNKTKLIAYPTGKTGAYSVPSGVKTIGDSAFVGAEISSITLPSGLETIEITAFWQCSGFSSITIPASVKEIGHAAFVLCNDLTSISVNSSNKYFSSKNGVLFDKNKTTLIAYPTAKSGKYTVPTGVTSIDTAAFQFCSKLTEATLPKGVEEVGYNSFYFCEALTKVTLPKTLTYLGGGAFTACSALETVNYAGTMEEFDALLADSTIQNTPLFFAKIVCSDGNIVFDELNGYVNSTKATTFNLTKAGKLTISGAGEWDYSAFELNMSVKEVTLNSGVNEIGYYAFMECYNLKKITIPKSVKSIAYAAFMGCTALTDVYYAGTMAEWVKLLQTSADIVEYSIDDYDGLSWATVHCSDGDWEYDGNGLGGDSEGDDEVDPSSFDMVLPEKITEIDAQAFRGSGIMNLYIPYGCKKINKWAFKDCDSLRTILVPSSVTFIADDAFEGCDSTLTFIVGEDNDYAKDYAEAHGFVARTSPFADAPEN